MKLYCETDTSLTLKRKKQIKLQTKKNGKQNANATKIQNFK